MKKFLIWFVIVLALIIGGILVYALYYLPNQHNNTDNSNAWGSAIDTATPITGATKSPTAFPTISTSNPNLTYTIFMDKNSNGQRDANEATCTSCFARALVCSNTGENLLPRLSQILNISIGANGSISSQNLHEGYYCWSSIDDKNILIPTFNSSIGDSAGAVYIPAITTTSLISGVNMNIGSINSTSSYEYTYIFQLLIPILQTEFSQGKSIWVKFTPDLTKPDSYFIKTASIKFDPDESVTGIPNSYYMQIDWGFGESYTTSKNVANYTFII